MADDVFKQTRKKITPSDLGTNPMTETTSNPMENIAKMQESVAKEMGREFINPIDKAPFEISGNIPNEFKNILMQKAKQAENQSDEPYEVFESPPERPKIQRNAPVATGDAKIRMQGTSQLENLLQQLSSRHQWEAFELPSKGKFYTNIPAVVHIRAMTGEEEQVLATQRYVKRGEAIDKIFKQCINEPIITEDLLSADRTHLLIYLRGISYTPEYDVEIKCPSCGQKFPYMINLNHMDVEVCPDDFGPENLQGTLPISGFHYTYRLPTGADEQQISTYREQRLQQWGDQGNDDTLLYRTALLLEEIEGVTMKKELSHLLKKLPISDVSFLRNEINQPPFGVDTEISLLCASCSEPFKIDLPLEANFFFPRKKEKIQA